MNDLKEEDEEDIAFKRRIRALVDRLEKGEEFKEEFDQSFEDDQGEREDIANTSFSYLRKAIFSINPEIRTKAIKGFFKFNFGKYGYNFFNIMFLQEKRKERRKNLSLFSRF